MNKPTPETDLISQLTTIRQALSEEREGLLARVAVIDEALAAGAPSPAKPTAKAPKATGIREAITSLVTRRPGQTIRELQEALPEHPPKTVENTVRAMASAGQLSKDDSTPRKFTLPPAPSNVKAAPKANGVSASA